VPRHQPLSGNPPAFGPSEANVLGRSDRLVRFGRLRWWVEESPTAFGSVTLMVLALVAVFWVLTALKPARHQTELKLSLQPISLTTPVVAGPEPMHVEETAPEVDVPELPETAVEPEDIRAELPELSTSAVLQSADEARKALLQEAAQARDYLNRLKETLSGRAQNPAETAGRGDPNSTGARIARWVIRYPPVTPDAYARLLDHFGVELGWLDGSQIQYVSHFSSRPRRRRAPLRQENRVFWYPVGDYAPLDQALLRGLSIEPSGTIVHFYPKRIEQQLARLERTALRRQHPTARLEQVAQTVFGIRRTASGWAFYVIDIALETTELSLDRSASSEASP